MSDVAATNCGCGCDCGCGCQSGGGFNIIWLILILCCCGGGSFGGGCCEHNHGGGFGCGCDIIWILPDPVLLRRKQLLLIPLRTDLTL